jgi:dTDP-4-dehydrorhamnose reductase
LGEEEGRVRVLRTVPRGGVVKVLVIGAGGILGQHLMVTVPVGVDATFTKQTENHLYRGFTYPRPSEPDDLLNELMPDVVVNLTGESRPDVVEGDWEKYQAVNVDLPIALCQWCDEQSKYLIHVSSQAALDPVNNYGRQKFAADYHLEHKANNWVIVRPTFVLGIRPFPGVGRENPAERMLSGKEVQSVNDRYFAVSFAWEVADYIWALCQAPIVRRQVHYVGHPNRLSRYDLAVLLGDKPEAIGHDSLPGLAPRPLDTSEPYKHAQRAGTLAEGIIRLREEYLDREKDNVLYRAKELAAFLKQPYPTVEAKLFQGFGPLHNAVTQDFHSKNPVTEAELTKWYRTTDAYLWELSAYHVDRGFNYQGMVGGIAEALKSKGVTGPVACLGDGTGDLSLTMASVGMKVAYHDLAYSRTANFAESRFFMRDAPIHLCESNDFTPVIPVMCQAIVSLDFLEHVVNVEDWLKAIHKNLQPGGFFVAQNAFGMGSGPDGAMPMHLAVNDKWVTEWDPFLTSLGFVQLASNWYQKPTQ